MKTIIMIACALCAILYCVEQPLPALKTAGMLGLGMLDVAVAAMVLSPSKSDNQAPLNDNGDGAA